MPEFKDLVLWSGGAILKNQEGICPIHDLGSKAPVWACVVNVVSA